MKILIVSLYLIISLYLVEYAVELANAIGRHNQVHLLLSKNRVMQTIGTLENNGGA